MTNEKPWERIERLRGLEFKGTWPTLPELFDITAKAYPERNCFTAFDPDRITTNYRETRERIVRLSGYLKSLGIGKDDKVSLTGKNTPEWAIAYFAVLYAGAIVVPIDAMLKTEECANLVKAADSVFLFADEEKYDALDPAALGLKGKASLARQKAPYALDLEPGDGLSLVGTDSPKEDELAAILFTSGTTGNPKGVMLTHANLVSDCFLAQENLKIYHTDVFYALLPLHHSYTMLAVFIEAISVGAELVFGKRMATQAILKDLREAKVTMFLGVPLLFNKVLSGIMKGIRDKGPLVYGLIRTMMFLSGTVKKTFGVNPGKKMFGKVLDKASLASNRICISGGGPLAASIFSQYNQLGIDFVQGYGLTETSPILALNPKEHYKVESVGKMIGQVEVRIERPDERGIGEIVVKGPMVMRGYYKMPEETKAMFTEDGFLKTGDLGKLDSENYLYLAGRAKNLIVTEGGKNVYPEEIENAFQLYGAVDQILIRGYLVDKKLKSEGIEAVIHPSDDFFRDAFAKENVAYDLKEVERRLRGIVDEVNATMQPYQRISKVTITEAAMEMTSTKKIKRSEVKV